MTEFEPLLATNRLAFDCVLDAAEQAIVSSAHEKAAQLLEHAALLAADLSCIGAFNSQRMEILVLRLGQLTMPVAPMTRRGASTKQRVLHVTTEAYPMWGHTATICNWIRSDESRVYSVALTTQRSEVPRRLAAAVEGSGGRIYRIDPELGIFQRARNLLEIATEQADAVILQQFPADFTASFAFSSPGGPPVIIYDSADHLFWTGVSVADCVFQMNQAGRTINEQYRGCRRTHTLPIPLKLRSAPTPEEKQRARNRLGIPDGRRVVLTSGTGYKYEGRGNPEFLDAALRLLRERNDVHLVAAGPIDHGRWRSARLETAGRLQAFGPQTEMKDFHDAADIYIEGFPFGSTTALLENALLGTPCVLAPLPTVPPFMASTPALDNLTQPRSVDEYITQVKNHLDSPVPQSTETRAKMIRYHCGLGWLEQLEAGFARMPAKHCLYELSPVAPPPANLASFWLRFKTGSPEAAANESGCCRAARACRAIIEIPEQASSQIEELKGRVRSIGVDPKLRNSILRSIELDSLVSLRKGSTTTLVRGLVKHVLCGTPLLGSRTFWATVFQGLLGERAIQMARSVWRDRFAKT